MKCGCAALRQQLQSMLIGLAGKEFPEIILRGKKKKKEKEGKLIKRIKKERRTSGDVAALCVSQYYKLSGRQGNSSQRSF